MESTIGMESNVMSDARQFNGISLFGRELPQTKRNRRKVPVKVEYLGRRIHSKPQNSREAIATIETYEHFVNEILWHLYPKHCPTHGVRLSQRISTRRYAVQCPECNYQESRFARTPLHHFKLPLYMFGWALHESLHRFPKVLSSAEIQRRLKIGNNSALMLKRRLQLFASDQMPRIKELMREELANRFEGVELPPVAAGKNVNEVLAGRPVPHVDVCAIFSASQRANKGRARHKHTGLTASIYLSDKLSGRQIGTLVHTLAIKKGPVIYDSIPNTKAESIRPLIEEYVPKDVPLFSDEGYRWFNRCNLNFRMVNHSRKSADKRYKWARNRWSINGINNQVAEGNQRSLKYNFIAGYGYFRPEYSQLYLNEHSFWKCVKYYGWEKLIRSDEEYKLEAEKRKNRAATENINKIEKETVEEKTHEPRPEALVCDEKAGKGKEVRAGFEGVAEAKKRGLRGEDLTGQGTGEGPGFSRICVAKAEPGKMPGSPPPEGGLRFRRGKLCETWITESPRTRKSSPARQSTILLH